MARMSDDMIPDSLIMDDGEVNLDDSFELLSRHDRCVLHVGVKDGRRIVLKGLPEELRSHPEEVARLRKEYQLGIRIDHQGVARIYWFENHARFGPVIAMEYIDGVPLNRYLDSTDTDNGKVSAKRLPPLAERRRIAFEIADALAAVHSVGISHRDLKPDNIMIAARNRSARIIDFGHGDSDDYMIYKNSLATERYGAPEQQQPAVGDMSSDVYSFGKILEELLPERRFSSLRRACMAADSSARPAMSTVAARLDPSASKKLKTRILAFTIIAATFMGGALSYKLLRHESPAPAPVASETSAASDTIIADVPTATQTRPTAASAPEVNAKEDMKKSEPDATPPTTSTAPKSADEIINTYPGKLDALFKSYGHLDKHDFRTDQLKIQRYQKALVISKEFEKSLSQHGLSKSEIASVMQQFWTYYQLQMNKIDGYDEYIENYKP